jgi:cell division septation protein DedD
MDPALKHRLIGAAVLSAVAVIFLPKLLVSHDTRSTAADVPLKLPNAPGGDFQTRELPLVTPASDVPQGGVVGMDTRHPTPSAVSSASAPPASNASIAKPGTPVVTLPTTTAPGTVVAPPPVTAASTHAAAPVATTPPVPAANAGGHYVVSLGTYGNAANAQSLVASLKKADLPAYAEPVTVGGKPGMRVRIGPYPQRGDAEAARLKAQSVRTDMPATVVALDAATPAPEIPASPNKPSAAPPAPAAKPATAPGAAAAGKPNPGTADLSAAAASKPATPSPAAAGRGYVVQLVAFRSQEEALALRDKLRAAGYTAFSEKVVTESATLYRVRIGPEADRDGADRLRAEVSAKFGLSGIVVAYP